MPLLAEAYGYPRGQPCVLLKISRMYGWEPEPYYNVTEILALETMPKSLKSHIVGVWKKNCFGRGAEKEARCPNLRMAWISCEGDTAADAEYMGPLKYTPKRGFPGYYFPYLSQQNYLR